VLGAAVAGVLLVLGAGVLLALVVTTLQVPTSLMPWLSMRIVPSELETVFTKTALDELLLVCAAGCVLAAERLERWVSRRAGV